MRTRSPSISESSAVQFGMEVVFRYRWSGQERPDIRSGFHPPATHPGPCATFPPSSFRERRRRPSGNVHQTLGLAGTVPPPPEAGVTPDLAGDRRPVAAEIPGNLADQEAAFQKPVDVATFLTGQMAVACAHWSTSLYHACGELPPSGPTVNEGSPTRTAPGRRGVALHGGKGKGNCVGERYDSYGVHRRPGHRVSR